MSGSPDTPAGAGDSLAADLTRLEEIVRALEAEDLELDRALALFEEGVRHLKRAQGRLAETEARVQRVLEDARGSLSLADLDV